MKRFINPVPQFLKTNGDLCSAGKLYFLQEGTDILTSTKAIYLDAEGASQSINPVPLSNEGRMSNVFGEGKYRAKLYDSANVLQWTRDIDFDAESAQFEEWNSQVIYSEKAITQGSDDDYYISEVDNNKGNDPTVGASAQYWSKIALIEFFNADKPGGYADNAVVIDAGRLYASNTANNTNTPPHATWDDLSFNNAVTGNFSATGTITAQNITVSALKTSSTARASTTAVSPDPDLIVTGLVNGGYYHIQARLKWNDNSGGAANGLRITLDSGVDMFVQSITYLRALGASNATSDSTAEYNFNSLLAGSDETVQIDAIVRLDGASTSVSVLWAQNTSSATNTTIKTGHISATKIG